MNLVRHLGVATGVAGVLAMTACGGGAAPDPAAPSGPEPSLSRLEPAAPAGGFDECGLVDPADLAAVLGVPAVHVTSREVLPEADGGRLAGCSYFTEDVPGIVGMTINTVAGTDREAFFRPFAEREVRTQPGFGDHAELVTYRAGSVHFRELRVLDGSTGVHFRYTYNGSPGGMPDLDDDRLAVLIGGTVESVLAALPDELEIADGEPEGPCADIDIAQVSRVLGGELSTARAVQADDGALNCQFAGAEASLGVIVMTDPVRVQSMRAAAEEITVPDLGDGARVSVEDVGPAQGPLTATVNQDDRLLQVLAEYGDGAGRVTTPRSEDVELVRSIADAIG